MLSQCAFKKDGLLLLADVAEISRTSPSESRNESSQTSAPIPLPLPHHVFFPTLTIHSHLSSMQRAGIVTLSLVGMSTKDISQVVGCDRHTVAHWRRHYKQFNNIDDEERSGRKRKLSDDTCHELVQHATALPFHSRPQQLKQLLPALQPDCSSVSARTIRRVLDENGLYGRVARKCPPFTDMHVLKRLAYANGYSHWTTSNWEKVLFTDEKIIDLDSSRVWVQRPVGEAFNPKYTITKQAHPPKVNVWGCFSAMGPGALVFFDENMDSKLLLNILAENVLKVALTMWPNEQWYFLQDNDPKHKSGLIKTWFFNNGVTPLDHPACSPDLNPIENMWSTVEQRVEDRRPRTIEIKEQYWDEEWMRDDKEMNDLRRKLAHSMVDRLQKVIRAKGHKIDY